MEKKQAQQLIQQLFTRSFELESYRYFIRNLLNHYEERSGHYTGDFVPDAFKQHINQYWRIGKYVDPDGNQIDLLVVEVKSLAKLERARSSLRNFAINRLKQFEKEASLIAFYAKDDNGADWRFSFVKVEHEAYQDDKGKVKLKQELTPARRYSYLVGEHENSHTACKQLLPILTMDYADPRIQEVESAFSIEKVTKEFFEQYKELFVRLTEVLVKQSYFHRESDEEKRKKNVAKFAKKLLGQIVFLYFLQKKGWLGVKDGDDWGKGDRRFLQKLFADTDKNNENYYVESLQYLFYEALAHDRKDQFDPSYYKKFDCKIPFLNGGLFEADYDWQKIRVEIPNSIFSNNDKTKAGDEGSGILDVFDRYNFTIKEDEPLEKEVAIDPEMLGKVFENMLEITERKSKGAFYTPREIVHYMCQESLINYLNHEVGSETQAGIPKEEIEFFIRNGHLFIENNGAALQVLRRREKGEQETVTEKIEFPVSIQINAKRLDFALSDIKVCDPAIGSGAFPVGMLNEVVQARQALISYLPYDHQLSPYELKKHTIAHSIYGVDIDPSAIDIARLRLWLSLVVDEDNYTSIDALPNLDYKIMQGNSLVEKFEGVELFDDAFIDKSDDSLEREKAELKQQQLLTQTKFFAARNAGKKDLETEYEIQLNEMLKALNKIEKQEKKLAIEKAALAAGLFDLISDARKKANQLENLHLRFFNISSPSEKRQLRDEIASLEWELIEATLKEQNKSDAIEKLIEYRTAGENPWFLWKLNFSEVFKQKGGFDIVIGNPPYVQIQNFSGQQVQKDWEAQKYESFTKTGDIYCLFYEKSHRLLKDKGSLVFITSNKWMRAAYGEKLRRFFSDKTQPLILIDFSTFQVFETATVDTNVLLFEKTKRSKPVQACQVNSTYTRSTPLGTFVEKNSIELDELSGDSWIISDKRHYEIKRSIEAAGVPLKNWDIAIYRGILTGFNEAFIIDGHKKDELISADPKSADILKPILRGRDIKRYRVDFADLWLINTHNGYGKIPPIDVNDYPAIKAHLENIEKQRALGFLGDKAKNAKGLFKRDDQGKTPYNLRNCAYIPDFEKEKIVWGNLALSCQFAMAEAGLHINAPSPLIAGGERYLLAILNSSVADYYIRSMGVTRSGGYFEYKPMFVESLPVPELSSSEKNTIETLTNYVLTAIKNQQKLHSAYIEQLLNGLIYELYFPDKFKAAGKAILSHVSELTCITDDMSDEEKLAIIQREFDRLYDPLHPVRNIIETLDSIEIVRTISKALQRN